MSNNDKAIRFFRSSQALLEKLWSRWQDEKEYEDINDYLKPFEEFAKKAGVILQKFTKRPFGIKFSAGSSRYHATATARKVQVSQYK